MRYKTVTMIEQRPAPATSPANTGARVMIVEDDGDIAIAPLQHPRSTRTLSRST